MARVQLPVFVSAKWVIHDLIASTARSVITPVPIKCRRKHRLNVCGGLSGRSAPTGRDHQPDLSRADSDSGIFTWSWYCRNAC